MTSVATCSNNYSATRRPDFTIIVPVSIYHHVSYAETYGRFIKDANIGLMKSHKREGFETSQERGSPGSQLCPENGIVPIQGRTLMSL